MTFPMLNIKSYQHSTLFKKSIAPIFLIFTYFFYTPLQAQKQDVRIRIEQEESTPLTDFQTNIKLNRKSFKIHVMLENIKGVYVFASIRDSVYRFTETGAIQDFVYLPLLELREDEFNQNKELNLSETGWSYWFYDTSIDWHPFNRRIVQLDNNRIVCTKIIKQCYDVAEGKIIKIKDIKKPLYLFFISIAQYDENGKPLKELMRRKVKIEWSNED